MQAQSITPAGDNTGTIVTPNGNQFVITGGSYSADQQNLFHSFQQFGLSSGQVATFMANPQLRNILGRITGGTPSLIDGLIQVTGGTPNLFLMNPAGIVFGTNASLNIPASFVATTANGMAFGDRWWSAVGSHQYSTLTGNPSAVAFTASSPGAIVNAGHLSVGPGQTLALLAGTVVNTGTLTAPGGTLIVGAVPGATFVQLRQEGSLLSLEFQPFGTTHPNPSEITPIALPEMLTGGTVPLATGVTVDQGVVRLTSTSTVIPPTTGTALVSGTLSTTSPDQGGTIQVVGDRVGLFAATLNASGTTGGGTVFIGGQERGQGSLPTAQFVQVDRASVIQADSLTTGNGGRVVVWADQNTRFDGTITAKGGQTSGDGGWVEVSGKNTLTYRGQVDLTASGGETGTLLLDPETITIVASGGLDDAQLGDQQVFAADGGSANYTLSIAALRASLLTANTILEATSDIIWNADAVLDYNGIGPGKTLTLRANRDITFAGQIFDGEPDADSLGVTLWADNTLTVAGSIQSEKGNIALLGDKIDLTAPVAGRGTLSLQPASVGRPIQLSGLENAGAVLDLTQAELGLLGNSFTQITIGNATTPVNLADNLTVFNPLLLNVSNYSTSAGTLTMAAGSLTMQANQAIAAGDINAFGQPITLTSGTTLTTGLITNLGGNVTLTSGGDLQVTAINAQGNAASSGGNVTLVSQQLLRITGSFIDQMGTNASISTMGGFGSGAVQLTLRGQDVGLPFTIGDAAIAGTAAAINTGLATLTAPQSVQSTLTQGNIQITNLLTPPPPGIPPAAIAPLPTPTPAPVPLLPPLPPTPIPTITRPPLPILPEAIASTNQPVDSTAIAAFDPKNSVISTSIRVDLDQIETTISTQFKQHLGITDAMTANFLGDFPKNSNPNRVQGSNSESSTNLINQARNQGINSSSLTNSTNQTGNQGTHSSLSINPTNQTKYQGINSNSSTNSINQTGTQGIHSVTSPNSINQAGNTNNNSIVNLRNISSGVTNQSGENFSSSSSTTHSVSTSSAQTPDAPIDARGEATPNSNEGVSLSTSNEDKKGKEPKTTRSKAQARLRQVLEATGVKPALLYVIFTSNHGQMALTPDQQPDPAGQLTLVFVPPEGEVVAKQVQGIQRSQVIEMANQMRQSITSPHTRRYLLPAQRLYQWLIAPVAAELQANQIQTLAVITESGLRSLPIAALHDGKQFLVEHYSVALMPSLDLTDTRLADIRQVRMLAMGASQFSQDTKLSDLPAVPIELSSITGQLWAGDAALNTEFTLENLTGRRSRQPYGIIHLATHADFQPGDLSNSYIQLWDKRLRLNQVRDLNWYDPPVSLVVLSACRTALGDEAAELGFAGFAVKAGAQSALASLWYVSDQGTLGFMTEFYRQLRKAPIKAEALRQTQIAMLQGQVQMSGNQLRGSTGEITLPTELTNQGELDLSHPFYWASFTLIGSPW
jgi:filamentous hemagglutinin family protein